MGTRIRIEQYIYITFGTGWEKYALDVLVYKYFTKIHLYLSVLQEP